jgi:hypothetical protein
MRDTDDNGRFPVLPSPFAPGGALRGARCPCKGAAAAGRIGEKTGALPKEDAAPEPDLFTKTQTGCVQFAVVVSTGAPTAPT